jgi:hypothetical protein
LTLPTAAQLIVAVLQTHFAFATVETSAAAAVAIRMIRIIERSSFYRQKADRKNWPDNIGTDFRRMVIGTTRTQHTSFSF